MSRVDFLVDYFDDFEVVSVGCRRVKMDRKRREVKKEWQMIF